MNQFSPLNLPTDVGYGQNPAPLPGDGLSTVNMVLSLLAL